MYDITVDVEVRGLREVEQRLLGIQRRVVDFTPMFLWAQDELRKANAENFSSNGLPVGGWAPLSPRYAAWKASTGARPPMIQSGRLFRSLVSLSGPTNVITPRRASFGTSVGYAKFHQYGTSKMPKRQVVFEPFGFAREFGERAARYVVDGVVPGLLFGGVEP